MDRNLQLLGIAKKAGLLAIGAEAVSVAARGGRISLIVNAKDASAGALRRARSNAQYCGAAHITAPYTMFEIGYVIGRGSPGTIAILDAGLAAGFTRGLAENDPGRGTGTAEQLGALEKRGRRTEQ